MPLGAVAHVWPSYTGLFIRHPKVKQHGDGIAPWREAMSGSFGLVPHWAKDTSLAKRTYNARSETVATKPSYRDAWRLGRRCIIPAEAIYEPDWR
jgi:putative SOS response-associated peptidase YedK